MKISKYTSLFFRDEEFVLYNCESDGLIILTPALEKVYRQYETNPDALEKMHPDFFNALKAYRFIVPKNEDEAELLIQKWKISDENPGQFGIIINPTLNCNLRCWYCYEVHRENRVMRKSTRQMIYNLIEKKTADPQLKMLNVSFFGGEPLLSLEENILPILRFAIDMCLPKGILLFSNFTTNAVLLTNEVLGVLNALPLSKKPTFQITLDGNRNVHDQIRVGINKKPTYDTIIKNIHFALQCGNEVFVRFNYTYDNILTFRDVLDDFMKLEFHTFVDNLSIKFEHVWQDKDNLFQSQSIMRKISADFEEAGFNVDVDDVHYRHSCYADSSRHAVINYNGDVFKCTARDFIRESREGVLNDNGDICWNDKFKHRMAVRYGNAACRQCLILPICNGGCTQNKIESANWNTCYLGMAESDKQAYLLARIDELIAKRKKTYKMAKVHINRK